MAAPTATAEPTTPPAAPPKQILPVKLAEDGIAALVAQGRLSVPSNYSVGNALQEALIILKTPDNDGNRVLDVNGRSTGWVTDDSIINSLREMVTQALSPMKKQCYFIKRGNRLTMQRSYHGDVAVAKRVRPELDFYWDFVAKGETIAASKIWSKEAGFVTVIDKHELIRPREGKECTDAYCGIVNKETGENLGVTLMDIARIKESWEFGSKNYTNKSPHALFTAEMAIRTVVRKCTLPIISSSDDKELLASIQRVQNDALEAEVAEQAALSANSEVLTPFPTAPVQEAVFVSVGEQAPAPEPTPQAQQQTLLGDPGY